MKKHPFADGNKRVGSLVLLLFLDLNIPVRCVDIKCKRPTIWRALL
ncbi:Fic family protein [Faecalibaculum rodentium]